MFQDIFEPTQNLRPLAVIDDFFHRIDGVVIAGREIVEVLMVAVDVPILQNGIPGVAQTGRAIDRITMTLKARNGRRRKSLRTSQRACAIPDKVSPSAYCGRDATRFKLPTWPDFSALLTAT